MQGIYPPYSKALGEKLVVEIGASCAAELGGLTFLKAALNNEAARYLFQKIQEEQQCPLRNPPQRQDLKLFPKRPRKSSVRQAPSRNLRARKRCNSTRRAGPASLKSCPPSRWRRSAILALHTRQASRCRWKPSRRIRALPMITQQRETLLPLYRTAPPSSAWAIWARSPQSP